MPLQDLDLVPVRVLHEEESCEQRTITLKLNDFSGRKAGSFHSGMFAVEVIDTERHVAVTVTQVIRLDPAFVYCQLDFEIRGSVSQVNKGKTVEIQTVYHIQIECSLVKRHRPHFIDHAKHRMNSFCQFILPKDRLYDHKERLAGFFRPQVVSRYYSGFLFGRNHLNSYCRLPDTQDAGTAQERREVGRFPPQFKNFRMQFGNKSRRG